jgi:hypothetical protein
MLDPEDMTPLQQVHEGLRIFLSYLSADNQGYITAEHDEIFVGGVHYDVLGVDDLAKLATMRWTWLGDIGAWRRYV